MTKRDMGQTLEGVVHGQQAFCDQPTKNNRESPPQPPRKVENGAPACPGLPWGLASETRVGSHQPWLLPNRSTRRQSMPLDKLDLWTGAPCSPRRTWAENDGRSPTIALTTVATNDGWAI